MTIMSQPPILTILPLFLRIHFILPTKKDMIKNGMANPSEYAVMYKTPDPGFDAASKITEVRIGPVHGVHPAAKAIPISIDPIKPEGRFLNSNLRSFIKNSGLNTPTIISPNNTMKIAPS